MQTGPVAVAQDYAVRGRSDGRGGVRLVRGLNAGWVRKNVHLDLGLLFALVEAVGQVLQEAAFCCRVETRVSADFAGALAEAGAEFTDDGGVGCRGHGYLLALEVLQVLDGHFEDVGLF